MRRIAVVGRGGFLGKAVSTALQDAGCEVAAVRAPRIRTGQASVVSDAEDWCRNERDVVARITARLEGCDTMVIASGLAAAGSDSAADLFGANAASPLVLCRLGSRVGVSRIVHVSSAAVQGRRDPLDESDEVEPFSPYSASKAAGEAVLRAECSRRGLGLIVYRPTSVQGPTRSITQQLVRFASLPLRPFPGGVPAPFALVENCAAAVAHLATCHAASPGIYLHPWEGVTNSSIFDLFGGRRRRVPLPAGVFKAVTPALLRHRRTPPAVSARVRQLELLLVGQRQHADALSASGFRLPVGVDGYARLSERIRGACGAEVPS